MGLQATKGDGAGYSPLTLAYIGDAVFELLVRSHVLARDGNSQAAKLHKKSAALVCAKAQSDAYFKIYDRLNDDELQVLKRGRNARSYSTAKNASISDYRHATGLEALFGYLYLTGKTERIEELFSIIICDSG
ncbi:MAG: ribonuclease III [Defluviitaleaceae bacterium]|nr:ribonuclease III [Defluviitaleaceae bacterium]